MAKSVNEGDQSALVLDWATQGANAYYYEKIANEKEKSMLNLLIL